ncbi:electron transport complex subunit RsxC [Candidatus Omnitrophota bacterium]
MVKLEENKTRTEHRSVEILPAPKQVFIPLVQHIGKPALPLVKAGERVLLGQAIADCEAVVSSPVHSSVSGKVTAIKNWPHPTLGTGNTIVIENDGMDTPAASRLRQAEEIERLTPDELRAIVRQAGIVGMGGAGFPSHVKLTPPKPVDTLILNGAECEPYATGDHRIMLEKAGEIIKGIMLITRSLKIQKVYIAIEDNKPDAIAVFRNELLLMRKSGVCASSLYQLRVLKSQYPQGGEKQLIKNILHKEIPSGKLPFDVGVLVHNVGTVLAIYEAVYKSKPLYERVVTLTGDCLDSPKNLLVRIGTAIGELVDFCTPLAMHPEKIIIGGPMMGITQYSTNAPIIKTSGTVVLLSSKAVRFYREENCIRCGECVRNCPVNIQPCMISLAAERKNWELAKAYSPLDCIECGLCAYLCPAKRNLVQSIKMAKQEAK